jgi:hypothetical protein
MDDNQYAVGAMGEIRKDSLLLSIAKEYLYEDVYIIKLGKDIERNILRLKDDIISLKKKFPGKFATEVETDGILEKINATALALIEPGIEIKENCRSGELGRKLESDRRSIADAVNLIRIQVQGKHVSYTQKDAVLNAFSGLKDVGSSVGKTLLLGVKILSVLIIIAVAAFLYLYYTMENEKTYLKQIAESQILMSERRDRISQVELRKEEISQEIKSLKKKDMLRGEKIAIMDLEVEMQKINQDRNNYEAEITAHENKISDNQNKIEEIKKTPFIKRLLRQ